MTLTREEGWWLFVAYLIPTTIALSLLGLVVVAFAEEILRRFRGPR